MMLVKLSQRRFSLSLVRYSKAEWKRSKVVLEQNHNHRAIISFPCMACRAASLWTGGGCMFVEVQVEMGV